MDQFEQCIKRLLPGASSLQVQQIEITEEELLLTVSSTQPQGRCPVCATPATRVQSHYTLLIGVFIREEGRKRLQLLLKGSEEDFSFEKEHLHIAVVIHATQFGAISILIIGRVSEVGNSKERTERWENAC